MLSPSHSSFLSLISEVSSLGPAFIFVWNTWATSHSDTNENWARASAKPNHLTSTLVMHMRMCCEILAATGTLGNCSGSAWALATSHGNPFSSVIIPAVSSVPLRTRWLQESSPVALLSFHDDQDNVPRQSSAYTSLALVSSTSARQLEP